MSMWRTKHILSHPLPYKKIENEDKIPDEFAKIGTLGSGTYGKVYEVIDKEEKYSKSMSGIPLPGLIRPEPSKKYAIKENYIGTSLDQEGDLKDVICSVRELDFLNLIKHHPYCISMSKVLYNAPISNIVFPVNKKYTRDKISFLLDKGDLDGEKFLHGHTFKPLVNDRKLFILHTFLAIEFLASRGIYHRDIKPANIICFLNPDKSLNKAKMTDFGFSMYYTKQIIMHTKLVTLWYRAPEIALCQPYGKKIDVWSLGCLLFETFSHGNRRFVMPEAEDLLINEIFSKCKVSEHIYKLGQKLYPGKITKQYKNLQNSIKSMKDLLECTSYEIEQFNCKSLGGKPNYGTFNELIDLLEHILVVNPKERYSVSEMINHSFFSGYKDIIDETRTIFGINNSGKWTLKPIPVISYKPSKIRDIGAKWFKIIYENRNSYPIYLWYHHRILFHAIEMFDRYIILENPSDDTGEGQIVIWVNTFLFISSKYFRDIHSPYSLHYYCVGFESTETNIFIKRAAEFEERVIKDIFQHKIYSDTIYEEIPEYMSETTIAYFLKIILDNNVNPETPLIKLWNTHKKTIEDINKKVAEANSPKVLPDTEISVNDK